MKKIKFTCLLLFFTGIILLPSCKDDDNENGNARLKMMLVDAPAAYDAVNIDIMKIEVNIDGDEESGWHELENINPGIYNLLEFRNGIDTAFADGEVPPGAIKEIRLILGPNNSVVDNGVMHALKTPSAQQSGLKLKINDELDPGILYEYYLDFDAEKSVVELGNGNYNLKPVIRVFTKTTTGSIEGFIKPNAANPYITAYNAGGDSISTRPDTSDGYFLIYGLAAGNYDVEFDATAPYLDTVINALPVAVGSVNNLDTIKFNQ